MQVVTVPIRVQRNDIIDGDIIADNLDMGTHISPSTICVQVLRPKLHIKFEFGSEYGATAADINAFCIYYQFNRQKWLNSVSFTGDESLGIFHYPTDPLPTCYAGIKIYVKKYVRTHNLYYAFATRYYLRPTLRTRIHRLCVRLP